MTILYHVNDALNINNFIYCTDWTDTDAKESKSYSEIFFQVGD